MELEDVKKLIAFDKETMQSVNDVYEKKASVIKAIAAEKEEIAKRSWQEVEKQVEDRKSELDKKIAQDKTDNEALYTKQANDLKARFEAKKDKCEKELFDACIK